MRRRYWATLNRLLDEIYCASDDRDWSWPDLARRAGLSYTAVWRLGVRRTQRPQLRTVHALAVAVGMDLVLTRTVTESALKFKIG